MIIWSPNKCNQNFLIAVTFCSVFSVLSFIGERNHKTGLGKEHPFHEGPATNETLKNTVQRRVKRRDGIEKGRKRKHKCPCLRGSELSERDHDESEKNRGSEEHGDDDSCDGTWPQHN